MQANRYDAQARIILPTAASQTPLQYTSTRLHQLQRQRLHITTSFSQRNHNYAASLQVQGSGFLYKQIRHMTGALLAVGEGKLGLQDISRRLEVGSTKAPGKKWRML